MPARGFRLSIREQAGSTPPVRHDANEQLAVPPRNGGAHQATFTGAAPRGNRAESQFGAARGERGLAILTTLGTGIGSALIYDGVLVPNTELGHLEIDGYDAEHRAAYSAMERDRLSWEQWAERLQRYYSHVEFLFSPDLFVVGGGVSKHHEHFLPKLSLKTRIVPAAFRNNAGILGAAALAAEFD